MLIQSTGGNVRWYRPFFPLNLIFFEIFTCTFETTLFRNKIAKFPNCTFETPLFRKKDFSKYSQNLPIFSENNPNFLVFSLPNQNFPVSCQISPFFIRLVRRRRSRLTHVKDEITTGNVPP